MSKKRTMEVITFFDDKAPIYHRARPWSLEDYKKMFEGAKLVWSIEEASDDIKKRFKKIVRER